MTELENYFKIINATESMVEIKLNEIIPRPDRQKRGLINGLGSIFKSITGNLDAEDGNRYDKLIEKLHRNQEHMSENIKNQNSLSMDLIEKFNETIQNINHNGKTLTARIFKLQNLIKIQTDKENIDAAINTANGLINLYKIIYDVLQDIQNSMTFTKLKLLHPSVINVNDLFKILKNLENLLPSGQLPFKITYENTVLYESLIEVECYISQNRVVYILNLPINYPGEFILYHLYSIPVQDDKTKFHAIIPNSKFIALSEKKYAQTNNNCLKISKGNYYCKHQELIDKFTQKICEVNLIDNKNSENCSSQNLIINAVQMFNIEDSNKWIVIAPMERQIVLQCDQTNIKTIIGTHLIPLQNSCQFKINEQTIYSKEIKEEIAPMIFDFKTKIPFDNLSKIPLKFENMKLDELQIIKEKINIIPLDDQEIADSATHVPWILVVLIIIVAVAVYSYQSYKRRRTVIAADNDPSRIPSPAEPEVPILDGRNYIIRSI